MSTPDPAAGATAPLPENASFAQTVLHSLGGKSYDYTTAPLNRAVLLLAVPMVLEMMMESLFALADVFWVSRLGREAIAVVGLTESVMTLIYAVAIGMCFAATAVVARRIGEKDPEGAAKSAGQIVLLGAAAAAVIGVVFGALAPDILRWMGADAATIAIGSGFTRIMLSGNATVFLIFLINAVFRGAGDPVLAMRTLWFANALNIILGPCFIFGWGPFPHLGVAGAAVATNIGRGTGVAFQLWQLFGKRSRLRLRLRHFLPDRAVMAAMLRPAWNGIAQLLISTTSWVGLFKLLSYFGSSALAGYTIAIRLIMAVLMPSWGLANAGATLVGQNLGANRPDRSEKAVWIALRFNVLFLGIIGAFFAIFSHSLVRLFSADPEVLRQGTRALWIVAIGLPLFAAGMCFEGAFNGSGDTATPIRLNFYCLWLVQIPVAWVLARTCGLGATGVYIAVPLSYSALAICGGVVFRRGRWKLQKV